MGDPRGHLKTREKSSLLVKVPMTLKQQFNKVFHIVIKLNIASTFIIDLEIIYFKNISTQFVQIKVNIISLNTKENIKTVVAVCN